MSCVDEPTERSTLMTTKEQKASLAAIRAQLANQDRTLAQAGERLAQHGEVQFAVDPVDLEAIRDAAVPKTRSYGPTMVGIRG
jgi:hypothetical protein